MWVILIYHVHILSFIIFKPTCQHHPHLFGFVQKSDASKTSGSLPFHPYTSIYNDIFGGSGVIYLMFQTHKIWPLPSLPRAVTALFHTFPGRRRARPPPPAAAHARSRPCRSVWWRPRRPGAAALAWRRWEDMGTKTLLNDLPSGKLT